MQKALFKKKLWLQWGETPHCHGVSVCPLVSCLRNMVARKQNHVVRNGHLGGETGN